MFEIVEYQGDRMYYYGYKTSEGQEYYILMRQLLLGKDPIKLSYRMYSRNLECCTDLDQYLSAMNTILCELGLDNLFVTKKDDRYMIIDRENNAVFYFVPFISTIVINVLNKELYKNSDMRIYYVDDTEISNIMADSEKYWGIKNAW